MENEPIHIYARQQEKEILDFVLAAVSTDTGRPILCGVYVDAEKGRLVGVDGFRINYAPLPECFDDEAYHNKVLKVNKTVKHGVEQYYATPWLVICEEVSGNFPKYEEVIPADKPFTQVVVNPALLSGLLAPIKKIGREGGATSRLDIFPQRLPQKIVTTWSVRERGNTDPFELISVIMPKRADDLPDTWTAVKNLALAVHEDLAAREENANIPLGDALNRVKELLGFEFDDPQPEEGGE